jgi:transcriptional regulator with XRE-family HTH domain
MAVLYMSGTRLLSSVTNSPEGGKVKTGADTPNAMFCRRVKEVRENARPKLTQETLARRLMKLQGISDSKQVARQLESYRVKVSRTEAGKRAVTIDDLFLFAEALDVFPSELLSAGLGSPVVDQTAALEERVRRISQEIAQAVRDLEGAAEKFDIELNPDSSKKGAKDGKRRRKTN